MNCHDFPPLKNQSADWHVICIQIDVSSRQNNNAGRANNLQLLKSSYFCFSRIMPILFLHYFFFKSRLVSTMSPVCLFFSCFRISVTLGCHTVSFLPKNYSYRIVLFSTNILSRASLIVHVSFFYLIIYESSGITLSSIA